MKMYKWGCKHQDRKGLSQETEKTLQLIMGSCNLSWERIKINCYSPTASTHVRVFCMNTGLGAECVSPVFFGILKQSFIQKAGLIQI